ncbi:hypothetical protein GYM75_05420 [Gilliamella sp. ESL0441]|uniref:hypothetical protein n=1 Tax=Gilliamella sp. ESL0441 TaxID=2704654 RepID=UPI001C699D39|nr:hypothetical protein [Gilliamella sp. ESL0441]QYN44326.1 hypothetical protein GYM75_05420 [Gilliamella sp. ESL0441]
MAIETLQFSENIPSSIKTKLKGIDSASVSARINLNKLKTLLKNSWNTDPFKKAEDSIKNLSNEILKSFEVVINRTKVLKNPNENFNTLTTKTKNTGIAQHQSTAKNTDNTLITPDEQLLLSSLNPINDKLSEFNKKQSELAGIYQKAAISQNEYNDYMTLLNQQYDESIDPLGNYNKELGRTWELMKLSSQERAIENEFNRITLDLMNKGLILNQQQNAELRKTIELNQEYLRILAIKDGLENNSKKQKQQDFGDLVNALSLSELDDNEIINVLNTDSRSPFTGMFENSWSLLSLQIEQYQSMYDQINVLTEKFNLDQSVAASLRAQVWAKQNDVILSQADKFFGNVAKLQSSNNATMAKVGKAAAIAQAIVNTYQSANAAYASMAGIPYIGPALGAAAAAAAITSGMANVAAIRSQSTGFMKGGYTGNLARTQVAGLVHGQEFVMNASATQRIGVNNLEALQRGDMSSIQVPQITNQSSTSEKAESSLQTIAPIINIALVNDNDSAQQWLSTQEGVKRIMQINRENGDELATIVKAC